MSTLKKVLLLLSFIMITWYVINYFFYKADLIQALLGIVPMILIIITTHLKENQEK